VKDHGERKGLVSCTTRKDNLKKRGTGEKKIEGSRGRELKKDGTMTNGGGRGAVFQEDVKNKVNRKRYPQRMGGI